jgi:2-dehydropantoate 2-reductase
MRILFVGAGALGGTMAACLSKGGAEVRIVDTDAAHVAAIQANGLRVDDAGHDGPVAAPAETTLSTPGWADCVIVMTTTLQTEAAMATCRAALAPDGSAATLQNGLGNVEALVAALGPDRVFCGSTKVSCQRYGPGHVGMTKLDPTFVGELDGRPSERTAKLAALFTAGGMPCQVSDAIEGVLWSKAIHNCAVNAPCAITGLRIGETARVPELDEIRWRAVEECLAVAKARGVALQIPDPIPVLRRHIWQKFTKPSMLQHMEAGREVEIDAINGFFVAEGRRLGVPTPVNETLSALAKARNAAVRRPEGIDYAAWTREAEAEVAAGAMG